MRNSQDQRHDPPESLYTTFLAPIKDGPSNLWGAGVTTPYNWSHGTLLVTGDGAHLVFSSFIFSWAVYSTGNLPEETPRQHGPNWGVMIPLLGCPKKLGSMGYGCILPRNGVIILGLEPTDPNL